MSLTTPELQLDLDKAARSFERVYDLKPNAYVWQAGIAYYYLGNFKRASEIFAQSAEFYESRFGDYASEERIWRNACELKYLSQLNRNQKRALQESNAMAQHINPAPTRDLDSEPLEPERRCVKIDPCELFRSPWIHPTGYRL